MMSVVQWGRRVIGERTSAAMQAAKRTGRHRAEYRRCLQPPASAYSQFELIFTLAGTAQALTDEGLTTLTEGL